MSNPLTAAPLGAVVTLDRLPKAVFQAKPRADRSERYVHINTRQVIAEMEREGFVVAAAQVTRSRHADPLFARHQIELRRPDIQLPTGDVPRFLFMNSHDGSTSARINLGIYRFICSNGLMVGSTFAQERVRHAGDAAADILERVRKLSKNTKPLFDQVDRWSRKQLTTGQALKFGELASVLRWGDPHRFKPEDVLRVRRAEDDNGTLWAVFNRAQENAMRGGLIGLSGSGRRATSRPLSDIAASNDFNQNLWRLAEEFAEL